jgi:thymidylate kinase
MKVSENLEYPDFNEKFDFIFCRDVIEHTPSPLNIVKNNYKYLSDNGLFYTSTLNPHQETYVGGGHLIEAITEAKTNNYIRYFKTNFKSVGKIDGLYNKKKSLVVIEGILGSGKTTAIDNFISTENILSKINLKATKIFPECMTNVNIDFNNQSYYKHLDILKCILYSDSDFPINLMERNYTSTLAYTYAKSIIENNPLFYESMIDWYKENINVNLTKPALYIYLDLPDKLISARLKNRNQNNIANNNWTDNKYLTLIKEFYNKFFIEYEPNVPKINVDAKMDALSVVVEIKKILKEYNIY